MSGIGRGVVVTSWRGRAPRRRPNCSMSKVASAWCHLASSSHQAASNCGPRNCSGSSAEKQRPTAPLGHSSRRREGVQAGRSPGGDRAQQAGRPFDHDLAGVVLGLADQRDVHVDLLGVRPLAFHQRAHPFGAQPRLAGAAPGQHQPGRPGAAAQGAGRRLLVRVRQRDEVALKRRQLAWAQRQQEVPRPAGWQRKPQCGAQAPHGGHRYRWGGRRCRHGVDPQGRSACAAVCSGSR